MKDLGSARSCDGNRHVAAARMGQAAASPTWAELTAGSNRVPKAPAILELLLLYNPTTLPEPRLGCPAVLHMWADGAGENRGMQGYSQQDTSTMTHPTAPTGPPHCFAENFTGKE